MSSADARHRRGDHGACTPAWCDALRTASATAVRPAAMPPAAASRPATKARRPVAAAPLAELAESAGGPLVDTVDVALAVAPTKAEDAGVVALAHRYAALIDNATIAAKYRKPLAVLRRVVALYSGEEDAVDALDKIADALAAHSVASDLGPKLLAALTALGMTVASRGAKGGSGDAPKQSSPLDELRRRRAQRGTG